MKKIKNLNLAYIFNYFSPISFCRLLRSRCPEPRKSTDKTKSQTSDNSEPIKLSHKEKLALKP